MGLNRRLDIDKERISELEDDSEEVIQMAAQRDKKKKLLKEVHGHEGQSENIETHLTGITGGVTREKGARVYYLKR